MGEGCGELGRGGIVMYRCLCEGLREGRGQREKGAVEKVGLLDGMTWRCVIRYPVSDDL